MEGGENGDMQTVMENFQKKNNLVTGRTHHVTHHPQVTTTSSQVIISGFSSSFFFLWLSNICACPPTSSRFFERGKTRHLHFRRCEIGRFKSQKVFIYTILLYMDINFNSIYDLLSEYIFKRLFLRETIWKAFTNNSAV